MNGLDGQYIEEELMLFRLLSTYTHFYTQTHSVGPSICLYKTHITAIRLQQRLQREQVNILTVHALCCRPMLSLSLSLSLCHVPIPILFPVL